MNNSTAGKTGYESVAGDVLLWVSKCVSPACIVVGCIVNPLSAIIWLNGVPGVAKTSKIYYFCLAIAETTTLLTIHLFTVFLGMGLHELAGSVYTTGGNLYLCRVLHWLWPAAEQTGGGVLVALTFERLCAVFYPLKVQSICTVRRTHLLMICLTIGSLLLEALSFYTEHPDFIPPIFVCVPDILIVPWGNMRIWYVTLVCFTLPIVLVTVGNVCLLTKIFAESRKRMKMFRNTDNSKVNAKEMSAAITVISIAFLHMIIYIPDNTAFYAFTADSTNLTYFQVGYTFLSLTALTHCANFFVYITRIPGFRHECAKLLGLQA